MTWILNHLLYRGSCKVGNILFDYIGRKEGIRYELIGKENIPKEGEGTIVYMNHTKPLRYNLFGIPFKFDSVDHLLVGFKTDEDIHFVEMNQFSKGWAGVYNNILENIPISNSPKVYSRSKAMAENLLSKGKIIGIFRNPGNSNKKASRLAAKWALEYNTNFVKVDLNLIGKDGKEPQTLVCPETAVVQIRYHPAIKISEFRKNNPGKSERELERLLTNC